MQEDAEFQTARVDILDEDPKPSTESLERPCLSWAPQNLGGKHLELPYQSRRTTLEKI